MGKKTAPFRKPWTPSDDVEFTYKRGGNAGDITIFAVDKADAARTLAQHGFTDIDLSKLVKTGMTLAEYLAAGDQKKDPIQ